MKRLLQFWQLTRFYRKQFRAIGLSLLSNLSCKANSPFRPHRSIHAFDPDGTRPIAVTGCSSSRPEGSGLLLLPQPSAPRTFSSEQAEPGKVLSVSQFEDPRRQYRFLAEALVDLAEEYNTRRMNGDDPTDVSKLVVFNQKDKLAQWMNGVILESTFIEDCSDRKKMLKEILEGFASKEEYLRRLFNFHLSVHLSILSFRGSMLEKEEFRRRVEEIPKVISELTVLLTKDNALNLRGLVVTDVLWKLIIKCERCRKRILEVPEILDLLVGLLSHDEFPRLQSNAAIGLATLVQDDDETERKILNIPGAGSKIVLLLSKDVTDSACPLHSNVATLLGVLTRDRSNRKELLKSPKILMQLVGLLSPENDPKLLSNVARVLGLLAEGDDEIRRGIGEIPGEVLKTVFLLSRIQDDSPGVRLWMNAAGTLAESVKDGKVPELIAKWPEVVERLVELLLRDARPEFRGIV